MKTFLYYLAIYWLAGCIGIGAGAASHENHCPNDPELSATDAFYWAATWPFRIGYLITKRDYRDTCKS